MRASFIGAVLIVSAVATFRCARSENPAPPPPSKTAAHDPNDDDLVLVDAAGKVSKEIVCINMGGLNGKKKNVLWVSTKPDGQLTLTGFSPYDCTTCPTVTPSGPQPTPPNSKCQNLINHIGKGKGHWLLESAGLHAYKGCAFKYQACVDGTCGPDPIIMIDP
jgi:hypothetical protein